MGYFFKDLVAKYGLQGDNLQAWGTIDGYWFQISSVLPGKKAMAIRTAVHAADQAAQDELAASLAQFASSFPNTSYSFNNGALAMERMIPFTGLKTEDVDSMLTGLIAIFQKAGAQPACMSCNATDPYSFAKVNGIAMKLCGSCQQQISEQIAQGEAEHAEIKNNYLLGTIGAIGGALVGSIAWVVIGLLGYFAAIAGVAISFCAAKGYTLMKGKVTKPAIVIICIVCVVVLILAQFITYDILLLRDAAESGEQIGIIDSLFYTVLGIVSVPELTSMFVKDCLLGLLFLGLGAYSTVRQLFVSAKAPAGTFQRL